jgi:hypothetical protein
LLEQEYAAWIKKITQTPFVGLLIHSASGFGTPALLSGRTWGTLKHTNEDERIALRIKAGLLAHHFMPELCSCGYQFLTNVPACLHNSHILSCTHNCTSTFTTRHNLLNVKLVEHLQSCGIQARTEPTFPQHHLRPDGFVSLRQKGVIYDITFVDPLVSSHLSEAHPLQVRSLEKHHKYDTLAEIHDVKFIPITLSTYGEVDGEVDRLVHDIMIECPPFLRKYLRRKFFCLLQQVTAIGNAQIVKHFLHRMRGDQHASEFVG